MREREREGMREKRMRKQSVRIGELERKKRPRENKARPMCLSVNLCDDTRVAWAKCRRQVMQEGLHRWCHN